MNFDIKNSIDAVQDGTKEVAELAHKKAYEFHSHFVSKTIPKAGKFGDVVKFSAEMIPGVAEYNAIKAGNWKEFAIAAGIDVGAAVVGVFTAGTGAAAIKGSAAAARVGVKTATKEIAEAGAKKALKETVESGAKKAAKETIGTETERVIKETAEASSEKVVKEVTEEGAEKASKEVAEKSGRKELAVGDKKEFEGKYFTTSTERKALASRSKGSWDGLQGDSKFFPENPEAKAALKEKGVDSISYKDGNPDFSVVSESTVEIENMTSARPYNYSQADELCSKQWNEINKNGRSDWTANDVKAWRREHGYSWHERIDRKTMDLVPRIINDECKHYGGVAECRRLERIIGGGFDE